MIDDSMDQQGSDNVALGDVVPDHVVRSGQLPAMRYHDLPDAIPVRKMLGPGIILAGMALGSGEFILWPYITYRSGFVFFWAAILGVAMQYLINMEITRWTLATGETAVTGFCRLSKWWAPVFLLLNIIPWAVPAWATGAGELAIWLFWGAEHHNSQYDTVLAIVGLVTCGVLLTAGPVIYETVERIQFVLVTLVIVLVLGLTLFLVSDRTEAVAEMSRSVVTVGSPEYVPDLDAKMLLGALAFAGAGGTLNLAQSDYIKEKGYGMGKFIGRLTSPVTGKAEATSEIGFFFPINRANLDRWQTWWRNASLEHFFSFFVTCLVCLIALTLITYCLVFHRDGSRQIGEDQFAKHDLSFIFGEADVIQGQLGSIASGTFIVIGIAVLLTTEIGILDATSRISTNIVKTVWLRDQTSLSESRIYLGFLWATILLGIGLLMTAGSAIKQITVAASMNGGVMFLYSVVLLYLNTRSLPDVIRPSLWRRLAMSLIVLFFGYFTARAIWGLFG
ncbi:MAG: Nramp family divalent metal transporter [Planctomycetales bacterium]|nr:Nramp family divalent metal transporter [Planctomycetales bacterium]